MKSTWFAQLLRSQRPAAEGPIPARSAQSKERRRRRFRHKAELAAILVMLVAVFATDDASANSEASASSVHLSYSVARHQSTRLARGICSGYSDCYRYQVPVCKRRGPSRVDCLAMFGFTDGDVCGTVIQNRKTTYGFVQRRGWSKCKNS